jgi:hypothetical protein
MGKAEDAKTPPLKPQKQIYPPKKTLPPPPKKK